MVPCFDALSVKKSKTVLTLFMTPVSFYLHTQGIMRSQMIILLFGLMIDVQCEK